MSAPDQDLLLRHSTNRPDPHPSISSAFSIFDSRFPLSASFTPPETV
jgi:hypothetical protein